MAARARLDVSKRKPHDPRKAPRRRTAEVLVDALLEATSELLIKLGYDKATTNRIAERAGVSVGSLYQYFSSKQGLVAEVGRRQMALYARVFRSALERGRALPFSSATRVIVEDLLGEGSGRLRLRQILLDKIPREWTRDGRLVLEAEAVTALTAELERRGGEMAPGDQRLRAFVVLHGVQGAIEAALWERQDLIDGGALERELVRLIERYLCE